MLFRSTSGYDAEKDGIQTVTVRYSGKSTEFNVTVQVYSWELVGRTLDMKDILYELNVRERVTNGMYS